MPLQLDPIHARGIYPKMDFCPEKVEPNVFSVFRVYGKSGGLGQLASIVGDKQEKQNPDEGQKTDAEKKCDDQIQFANPELANEGDPTEDLPHQLFQTGTYCRASHF